jgi:hypothetical protein
MLIVRGTKKLLDRVGSPEPANHQDSTTALGEWFATVLFWRPQVALFLNTTTLLPVVVPFAPGVTLLNRFPAALAGVFAALRVDGEFIEHEIGEMQEHWLTKTNDRSVLGVLNGFAQLADQYHSFNGISDPLQLSLFLANTPCGPLFGGNGSPDRELAAFVARRG